jgi:hypothetical protein
LAVQAGVSRGEQIFTANLDGSEVERLAVFELYASPVALLDSDAVVVRGDRRWLRRPLDGGPAEIYDASVGAAEKSQFVLSPSGRLALDIDHEGFAVLDALSPAAPAVVPRRDYPNRVSSPPAWSPDERRFAFIDRQSLTIVDVSTGAATPLPLDTVGIGPGGPGSGSVWSIIWSPSGALQLVTNAGVWEVAPGTGAASKVADPPRPGGFSQFTLLSHSPDGKTLAAATDYGLFVRNAGDWKQISAIGVSFSETQALHWTPESRAVVYDGSTGSVPQGVIVAPVDGSGAYRLVAPFARPVLGWLPDGRIAWVSRVGGL